MLEPIQPNTFYRTSIKALILDENKKIFLAKDKEGNKWDLPGGGMDWGESPQACLAREIKEEMGIMTTWIADQPSYFYPFLDRKGMWFTNAVYQAKVEHLNFTPSDECMDARFFSPEEAKNEDLFSNVNILLELYRPERHAK